MGLTDIQDYLDAVYSVLCRTRNEDSRMFFVNDIGMADNRLMDDMIHRNRVSIVDTCGRGLWPRVRITYCGKMAQSHDALQPPGSVLPFWYSAVSSNSILVIVSLPLGCDVMAIIILAYVKIPCPFGTWVH